MFLTIINHKCSISSVLYKMPFINKLNWVAQSYKSDIYIWPLKIKLWFQHLVDSQHSKIDTGYRTIINYFVSSNVLVPVSSSVIGDDSFNMRKKISKCKIRFKCFSIWQENQLFLLVWAYLSYNNFEWKLHRFDGNLRMGQFLMKTKTKSNFLNQSRLFLNTGKLKNLPDLPCLE